jgi:adenylate kinase
MNIVLLGPPGAGKGTQASQLVKQHGFVAVSSGDMLRAAVREATTLGQEAQTYMVQGQLVPDAIIIGIILEHLATLGDKASILFDGFPRTQEQAEALHDAGVVIDKVIEMRVDDNNIISRMAGRLFHPASGRTGEPLTVREDDRPETVKKRLAVYHQQTQPVIDFYRAYQATPPVQYCVVDGAQPINMVASQIATIVAE